VECCSGTELVPGPRTVPGPGTGPEERTGPVERTRPVVCTGPAGRIAVPEGCTAEIVARTAVEDGRSVVMGQRWTPKTACRPRC